MPAIIWLLKLMTLEFMYRKQDGKVCVTFVWVRTESKGGLLGER
jgi:hypothetical protein